MNLLSNAVKYTPQGGIRFTAAYRAGMLEFCVADTGAGIPAEFLAKLYEPLPGVWKIVIMRKVRVSVCLWSKDSSNC